MPTITLTGNYGYSTYRGSDLAASTTIDASQASWIVANSRNQFPDADTSWSEGSGSLNTYPFIVYSAGAGLVVRGGTVHGEVPLTSDWEYTYNNSAAIRIASSPGVVIDDWRIDRAWDAIRIASGSSNFLIDDAYLTNVRDDAVENDSVLSGTIRDSLFDGVFSGISLGDGGLKDGSGNVVTLDGVLLRSQSFLYKGEWTHVSPIKANSSAPETMPDLRIINSVIAIEDPDHAGQGRLEIAWENVVESRGNVFLNLSDTPLPSDYPLPGAGWTILQGQQARDYWNTAKANWLANHGEGAAPQPDQPAPQPQQPAPQPEPTIKEVLGDSGSNNLVGGSTADRISGLGGDDRLFGKGGEDVLTGGSGKDYFVFDTAPGAGNVDQIVDFDTRYDYIYLDNAIFTKLGSGSLSSPKRLSSSYFESDGRADDSNDYVLYDKATGALSYDPDGKGSAAAIQIAQLQPNLDMTYWDIFVV